MKNPPKHLHLVLERGGHQWWMLTVVSRSSSEEVLRVSGLSREWAGGGCRLVGWGWQMPLAERVPVVGTGASSASACTRGRVHSAVLPVVTLVLLARSSGILLL